MALFALIVSVHAQNLTGKVVDEKNLPLPYANVVLQTADSVFLTGVMTDSEGKFELVKHENGKRISISFVGYTTVVRGMAGDDFGVIQLLPDAQLLGEVVVKAHLPKTQAKGDAMVTMVSGSMLEKAGTAEKLLDKIPNVTARDGAVNVFGRGTPEIYINGRKVRSSHELDQLSSDNIKSVEVVSNPGARYDASVKAVIRIITKKVAGEGFGIDNRMVVQDQRVYGWTLFDQLDINYRKNGFDVSGMLYGGKLREGNDQLYLIDTYLDKHWKQRLDVTDQKITSERMEAALSLNYQFHENHVMGARYQLERTPDKVWYANQFVQTYCDNQLREDLHSDVTVYEPETFHRSNFYYSGRIKHWSIDFNADGLWNDAKNAQLSEEDIVGGTDADEDRSVTTFDTERNELYAAKLVVSHPIAKGNLSLGAEYSHNKRNTSYFNEEGIIANDQAMIKEGATSAFVEYAWMFHKLQMQAGLRYERVSFDYYDTGKYVAEQSKDYSNLFPSVALSFSLKKIQVQLAYANDIRRPSYADLRSNVMYVNRYMYDKGNPFLMPSLSHNLTLGASYQWMNLYMGYSHVVDDITNHTVAYSDDDPTIAMHTLLNGSSYDKFVAALNFAPTIGNWHPQLGLAIQKQWYEGESPDEMKKLNSPIGSVTLRNNIKLPQGFLLGIDASWQSKGYSTNYHMDEEILDMSASLHKSFLKDQLSLQLNANNIFESKQVATVYSGIRMMQITTVPHRKVSFTLRYKFNTTKSKYKGTGAGESQKSRM